MPRNNRRDYTPPSFVHFKLESAQATEYDNWEKANNSRVASLVEDLLADNYKLSVSPDFENSCTIVTIICKSEDGPNANSCFSTRSETWEDALTLALYKHFEIAKGEDWPTDNISNSWG